MDHEEQRQNTELKHIALKLKEKNNLQKFECRGKALLKVSLNDEACMYQCFLIR